MTTVDDWLKNANYVRDNILDETERIVNNKEKEIINLQKKQIRNSIGNDGKTLKNSNDLFSGVYTLYTQNISKGKGFLAPKIAGQPYNFLATGSFFNGIKLDVSNDKTNINIFSTGTGSGHKSIFFSGYTNLFGLTDSNSYIVNYYIILPQLQKFIKQYL